MTRLPWTILERVAGRSAVAWDGRRMVGFAHLADAWVRTLRRAGGVGDIAGTGAGVLSAWAQPHRAYHDLRHLDEVLRRIDELVAHARDPDAVRLAAWFHDVVYDPTRKDNEERSAAHAEDVLVRLRVEPARVAEIGRLVRLTATHDVGSGDVDGAVLCDADLGVLAAAPARYCDYAEDVRREYAHLSEGVFAAGRAAVLRRLLERPELYRTPGAQAWEARARANMQAELARLTARLASEDPGP